MADDNSVVYLLELDDSQMRGVLKGLMDEIDNLADLMKSGLAEMENEGVSAFQVLRQAALRLGEIDFANLLGEGVRQVAIKAESTQEKILELVAAEAQLIAKTGNISTEFIKLAANAQQSVDGFLKVLGVTGELSQEQIKLARSTGELIAQLKGILSIPDLQTDDLKELARLIGEIANQRLQAIQPPELTGIERQKQFVEEYNASYEKLIKTELSRDLSKQSQDALKVVQANNDAREATEKFVIATGELSEEQITLAQRAANVRANLEAIQKADLGLDEKTQKTQELSQELQQIRLDQRLIKDSQQLSQRIEENEDDLDSLRKVDAYQKQVDDLQKYTNELSDAASQQKAFNQSVIDAAQQRINQARTGIQREQGAEALRIGAEAEAEEIRKQEQALNSLIAAELRLATAGDETARIIIDGARQGATSYQGFISALQAADETSRGFSQSQLDVAERTARLKLELQEVSDKLSNADQGSEAFNILSDRFEELSRQLREVADYSDKLTALGQAANELKEFGSNIKSISDLETFEELIVNTETLKLSIGELGENAEDNFDVIIAKARETAAALRLDPSGLVGGQQNVNREFQQLLTLFPNVKKQLGALVNEYGNFSVVVGKTTGPLSQQQRAFNNAINSSSKLRAAVDRLVAEYGEFEAPVNRANTAVRNFSSAAGKAGVGGIALGNIIARVSERFFDFAREALRVVKEQLLETLDVARQFDTFEALFTGIFDSAEVGVSVLRGLRGEAERLGFGVEQAYSRILPLVGDFEAAQVAAESLIGLQALAPELPAGRVVGALVEVLSGDLRTLSRTFEIAEEPFRQAVERFVEQGYTEAQAGAFAIQEVLGRYGLTLEELEQTITFQAGRIQERFRTLQLALGEPLGDTFLESLQLLNAFFEENRDDLILLAGSVGTFLAQIIDSVAEIAGIEEIADTLSVEELLDGVRNLTEIVIDLQGQIQILKTVFDNAGAASEEAEGKIGSFLEGFVGEVDFKKAAIQSATFPFVGILPALGESTFRKVNDYIQESAENASTASGAVAGLTKAVQNLDDFIFGRISSQEYSDSVFSAASEAYNETLEDTISIYEDLEAARLRNQQEYEEQEEALKGASEATQEYATAQLALQNATDAVTIAQRSFAEVQEEVNEKLAEAARQLAFDLEKNRLDLSRKLLESEIDLNNKRLELAREYKRDLLKIERDLADEQEDIRIDEQRDIDDAEKDAARERIDLELDQAQKIIDIEESLQERLAEIRRKADFDAEEAIRQNDAVALRRIRRRMEFDLNEARLQRDDEVEEAEKDAKRRREALQRELEREIEDARLAAERKREDALRERDREIRELSLTYKDELIELGIREEEKRAALQRAFEQRQEDLIAANEFKQKEIRRALDVEREAVEEAEKAKVEATQNALKALAKLYKEQVENAEGNMKDMIEAAAFFAREWNSIMGGLAGLPGSFPGSGGPDSDLPEYVPGYGGGGGGGGDEPEFYAQGGRFRANENIVVGDSNDGRPNPEIVSFDRPGTVTPISSVLDTFLTRSRSASSPVSTTVNNVTYVNASIQMVDTTRLSIRQQRQAERMVRNTLKKTFTG